MNAPLPANALPSAMPGGSPATAWLDAMRGSQAPCTQCGYDLRGLPLRASCPECGRPPMPALALVVAHEPAAVAGRGCSFIIRIALGITFLGIGSFLARITWGTVAMTPGLLLLLLAAFFLARAFGLRMSRPQRDAAPHSTAFLALGAIRFKPSFRYVSWRTVSAVRAERSDIVLDPRPSLARRVRVRTRLQPIQVIRLAEAIDELRALAEANPDASPPTLVTSQVCHHCGAVQRPNDPSRTCETCGVSYDPAFPRLVFGRTSPHILRRAVITHLALIGGGLTLFGIFVWSESPGLIVLAIFIALWTMQLGRQVVAVLRVGRRCIDSAWSVRSDRIDAFGAPRSTAMPWREIESISAGAPVRDWTPIELRVPEARGSSRTLWIDSREQDVVELVDLLRAMWRDAGAAPAATVATGDRADA